MFRSFLFLGLLAAFATASASSESPAQQAMTAGIEQFRQGNYAAAQQEFEVAVSLGHDSPALDYNLGVTYYKTGNYQAAEFHFSRLLDGSSQYLARYNMGLVAKADGRNADAEKWFRQAAHDQAPETVRELARRQLADLKGSQSAAAITQGYLAAGLGYDSNLAGVPDDSPSNRDSLFAELLAAGTLSQPMSDHWRMVLDGVLYGQDYARGSDFDSSVLQVRMAGVRVYDQWEAGVRASGARAWLDSEELETRYGLSLFARSSGCPLSAHLARCSFSVGAEQVDGGPEYRAYDGQAYQFEARAGRGFATLALEAFYRWQRNDRDDFRQDELFISVSPTHHELGAEVLYPVYPEVSLGAELALRHSRYADPHQWLGQSEGDSELVVQRREDVRLELGLMAEFAITRLWQIRNQWVYRDLNSRIDRYDYRRHTFTVSLEGVF